MDISIKARHYAESKVNEILTDAIAQAYLDGYNEGLRERNEKMVDKESEFIDLGLPSGTLWATGYLQDGENLLYLPYQEAQQYILPTNEQLYELVNSCKTHHNIGILDWMEFIVPNGKILRLNAAGYLKREHINQESDKIYFWLSDSQAALICVGKQEAVPIFTGFRLPVLVVK